MSLNILPIDDPLPAKNPDDNFLRQEIGIGNDLLAAMIAIKVRPIAGDPRPCPDMAYTASCRPSSRPKAS